MGWILYLLVLYNLGQIKVWGGLSYSAVFAALSLYLLYLVHHIGKRYNSKGIWLLKIALAMYALIYINRVYQFGAYGSEGILDVFRLTWASNLVVVGSMLAIILLCFGYWGFILDKSSLEKQDAESQNETMRQLMKERDQLLMVNARVSTISSWSSFSAMLVHDISQPLQALEFGLYDLQH